MICPFKLKHLKKFQIIMEKIFQLSYCFQDSSDWMYKETLSDGVIKFKNVDAKVKEIDQNDKKIKDCVEHLTDKALTHFRSKIDWVFEKGRLVIDSKLNCLWNILDIKKNVNGEIESILMSSIDGIELREISKQEEFYDFRDYLLMLFSKNNYEKI